MIAIIVLVVAVALLWFVYLSIYGGGNGADAPMAGGPPAEEPGTSGSPANGDEVSADDGVERPAFYDEGRSGRYEAFASLMPHLAFDDVVWRVNVDLDKTPYEDVSEVVDPLSRTALVTKHFYLPEDFSPSDLVSIGQSKMREEAAAAANEMFEAAKAEGHRLWVQSGYRSFGIQAGLFAQYSASDGEEAETYSARPGHSEHQLGLVADLNTISEAFGETPEGKWAAANCWYFGFIVRYTAENSDVTLYKPEPWHLRYIGREASTVMHDRSILSFEEYWVKYVAFAR